jgi:WD40 repeat protein
MGGLALSATAAVLAGGDGPVTAVTFDAGGGRVASGCAGGVVLVWDLATGEAVQRLVGHTGTVPAVVFRDDDLLCTAGDDGTVRMWDPHTGEELQRIAAHTGAVRGLAVSGEAPAMWLATAGDDGTVRMWDLVTGDELHNLTGHGVPVHAVACSGDGSMVAGGGDDGVAHVWSSATGAIIHRRRPQVIDGITRVRSLAFDPAGSRLAIGGYGFTAVLWDPRTGRETHLPTEIGYPVLSLAFSPDGTFVATASRATAVRVWDATTATPRGAGAFGTELCAPVYHPVMATSVAVSPDGERLATGGHDDATRIWRMAAGRVPATAAARAPGGGAHRAVRCVPGATLTGHLGHVRCIGFAPDGRSVATGGSDGTVRLWDPATGAEHDRLVVGDSARAFLATAGDGSELPLWLLISSPNDLSFSPDGTRLAAACGIDGVQLFDLDTGTRTWQRTVAGFEGGGHPVAADAVEFVDARVLATVFADHTIRMLDAATGAELHHMRGDTFVGFASLAVNHDATVVAVAGDGRDITVRLWNPTTGEDLGRLIGHNGHVDAVALSFDGTLLATAGDDHTVWLWKTRTWVPQRVLTGHTAGVRGVAFDGTGRLLASCAPDGVRLWDPAAGSERGRIDDPELIGATVTVSPDGRRVAVATADRGVRLWDVTPTT